MSTFFECEIREILIPNFREKIQPRIDAARGEVYQKWRACAPKFPEAIKECFQKGFCGFEIMKIPVFLPFSDGIFDVLRKELNEIFQGEECQLSFNQTNRTLAVIVHRNFLKKYKTELTPHGVFYLYSLKDQAADGFTLPEVEER